MHAQLKKATKDKAPSLGPLSPMPGTTEAGMKLLPTTTNTHNPERMTAVMVVLPV